MVYLNRIYTKSGDHGETGLGDGRRVSKTDARIIAYGGVDELNAVLGVAVAQGLPESAANQLRHIQNDLFDLGADLCVPQTIQPSEIGAWQSQKQVSSVQLRVTSDQVTQLEHWIDEANSGLEPLTSFILPGGTLAAANLHHARTICRRVEIGVLKLAERESINPQVTIYLNRLSDFLFVMSRACNNNGQDDILWVPGQSRSSEPKS
jgi:cob(I)alamin adenosyltransferase